MGKPAKRSTIAGHVRLSGPGVTVAICKTQLVDIIGVWCKDLEKCETSWTKCG